MFLFDLILLVFFIWGKEEKKGDSDFLVWMGGWLASSAECMEVIFWLLYYYQKKGNSISCAIFSKVEKGSPNIQVRNIKTRHKGWLLDTWINNEKREFQNWDSS